MQDQTPVQIFRREERQRQYRSGTFFLKIAILLFFILVPFLFPSFKTLDLALKIMIFAVLVASFDILLGYTGILSFGHVMFFGIGAYSVAMLIGKYGNPSYLNLAIGFIIALGITSALALLVSFLSLRVKAIFFAMVTLAIAEFAIILATKLSGFTGGEDGIIMSMPGIFKVSFNMGKFLGVEITGRLVTYYFILLICLGLFLLMVRFIHSPLGRVMQAIRDNEPRAEAIGYKTFHCQEHFHLLWMSGVHHPRRVICHVGGICEPGIGPGYSDHARRPPYGDCWRDGDLVRRACRRGLSGICPRLPAGSSEFCQKPLSGCSFSAYGFGALAPYLWDSVYPGRLLLSQRDHWVGSGLPGTAQDGPIIMLKCKYFVQ